MYKGIDVSRHQGTIDWQKVKDSGVEFAILRSSYGKEDKAKQTDSQFLTNYAAAKSVGMPIGCYHYSYATTVDEAKQEAEFFLDIVKGCSFEYPVCFDIEDTSQASLGKSLLSDIATTFCSTVQSAGYYVSIYASLDWLKNKLDYSKIKGYDIWLAQWSSTPTYTNSFGMWQYSSTGSVDGITTNVDMDCAYKDYPSIIKELELNGFETQEDDSELLALKAEIAALKETLKQIHDLAQ